MDSTTRESLISSFMVLGLTRAEAEIATSGPGETTQTARNDLGEIFEPVGRGGYQEF